MSLTLLVLGALAVGSLRQPARATWLVVEAPAHGQIDHVLPIRVTVRTQLTGGFLRLDLHWKDTHRESRGFLSLSPPQAIQEVGHAYSFDMPLPNRPHLGSVHGVIWAGETDNWDDRAWSVTTESIPVFPGEQRLGSWRVLQVFEPERPSFVPSVSTAFGWLVGCFWIGSGLIWVRRPWAPAVRLESRSERLIGRTIALLCLGAAVWECGQFDFRIAHAARAISVAHDSYQRRHFAQTLVTFILSVGLLCLLIASIRSEVLRGQATTLFGLTSLVGIAGGTAISLHGVDLLANVVLGPVPIVHWLKLCTAALTCCEAVRQARSQPYFREP